jgi:hypothetical protein
MRSYARDPIGEISMFSSLLSLQNENLSHRKVFPLGGTGKTIPYKFD